MEIDEHKAIRDSARSMQARAILDNELIMEAFNTLERSYIEAWQSTRIEDQLGREKLFVAVNVLGKVKQHLQNVVASGKVAENDIYQLALKRKRA